MAGLSAGHTICGIVRINGDMPVPERKKRYSSFTVCQQMLIDIIEEISVGTVIVLVSSLIAWLYHIRQLYATAPVLFQNASEGKDDAVYQIIVSNRGNQVEEKNLKAVSNQGWSNLDDYQESDLRQSYSDNEFPVRLVGIEKKADYSGTAIPAGLKDIRNQLDEKKSVLLKYEINNKTASDLGVLAFRKGVRNAMPFYRNVGPLSKETIFIPVKTVPASGIVRTEFMFRLNDEWLDRIDHSVNTGTLKETTGHLKQTVINPKPGKSQVALQ